MPSKKIFWEVVVLSELMKTDPKEQAEIWLKPFLEDGYEIVSATGMDNHIVYILKKSLYS